MRGKFPFNFSAAWPFIALLLCVAAFWYFIDKEGDTRAAAIEQRIEVEAELRQHLADETSERIVENERQIASLKETNDRQTRLILALGKEFPQLADDLGLISNGVVRGPTTQSTNRGSNRGPSTPHGGKAHPTKTENQPKSVREQEAEAR